MQFAPNKILAIEYLKTIKNIVILNGVKYLFKTCRIFNRFLITFTKDMFLQ